MPAYISAGVRSWRLACYFLSFFTHFLSVSQSRFSKKNNKKQTTWCRTTASSTSASTASTARVFRMKCDIPSVLIVITAACNFECKRISKFILFMKEMTRINCTLSNFFVTIDKQKTNCELNPTNIKLKSIWLTKNLQMRARWWTIAFWCEQNILCKMNRNKF